jgi:RNA polymerase sigma factor (sigma-70 family)
MSERSLAQAAALMNEARPKVIRMAGNYFRDPTTADNVFQETWIVVWQRWDKLADHPNQIGFVVTTAKHICLRLIALEKKQRTVEQRLASLPSTPSTDIDICERDRVEQAIAQLARRQREAIIYRYYLDFSESEIADAMGVRPGTVKALLSQARGKLRPLLTDH